MTVTVITRTVPYFDFFTMKVILINAHVMKTAWASFLIILDTTGEFSDGKVKKDELCTILVTDKSVSSGLADSYGLWSYSKQSKTFLLL